MPFSTNLFAEGGFTEWRGRSLILPFQERVIEKLEDSDASDGELSKAYGVLSRIIGAGWNQKFPEVRRKWGLAKNREISLELASDDPKERLSLFRFSRRYADLAVGMLQARDSEPLEREDFETVKKIISLTGQILEQGKQTKSKNEVAEMREMS